MAKVEVTRAVVTWTIRSVAPMPESLKGVATAKNVPVTELNEMPRTRGTDTDPMNPVWTLFAQLLRGRLEGVRLGMRDCE